MGAILTKLLEVFWTKKLDIVVIGLENRCVRESGLASHWIDSVVEVQYLVVQTANSIPTCVCKSPFLPHRICALTIVAIYFLFLSFLLQWKDDTLVRLGPWRTRRNRPDDRSQRQGL